MVAWSRLLSCLGISLWFICCPSSFKVCNKKRAMPTGAWFFRSHKSANELNLIMLDYDWMDISSKINFPRCYNTSAHKIWMFRNSAKVCASGHTKFWKTPNDLPYLRRNYKKKVFWQSSWQRWSFIEFPGWVEVSFNISTSTR